MVAFTDYTQDRLLASRPIELHFAGWRTDTHTLQRAGWAISACENVATMQMHIAARHEQWGLETMGNASFDYYREYHDRRMNLDCRVDMRAVGREVIVQGMGFPDFYPVDAEPQLRCTKLRRLQDLAHFAPMPRALTNPIVLPEASVDDLLAQILERQQAAKTDYFRDLVRREGQILPAHKFHAQIISLKEAA